MARWLARGIFLIIVVAGLMLLVLGPRPQGFRLPDGRPVRGRVVVTFWEKWTGHEQQALQQIIDRYNLSQSRVYVNLVSVTQVNQKTLISTAGGDPPDIAGLWAAQVGPYLRYDAIRPLDELVARGVVTRETYKPYLWDVCAPYGRLCAVSSAPEVMALFWNKQLFREAGLDPEKPPTSFVELDAFAEKLTRRAADGALERVGFLPREPGAWDYFWGVYFGNQLYDRTRDEYHIDTPEQRRAYSWYQSYANRYGHTGVQMFRAGFGNFNSPLNAFMSGKVAMVEQGPFFCNFIQWNKPGLDYGVAPFPVYGGKPGDAVIGDTDVWVIPTNARHPEEALEVLAFLLRQENIERLCIAHAKPSPLRKVSEQFYREFPSPYGRVFEQLMWGNVQSMPPAGTWERVQDELFNAAQKIWLGGDVAEVLREKQGLVDGMVAQARQLEARRGMRGKGASRTWERAAPGVASTGRCPERFRCCVLANFWSDEAPQGSAAVGRPRHSNAAPLAACCHMRL